MADVYNPGKRVNSRVGERTMIKGKVTWFWDSLMNQDPPHCKNS